MLWHLLILSLLAGAFAAPTEAPAKSAVDAKNAEAQKSAASLDEQNRARTIHLLGNLLHRPAYGYPYGAPLESLAPVHLPAPAPYAPLWAPAPAIHAPVLAPAAPAIHPPVLAPAPVAAVHPPVVSQTTFTKPVVSYTPTVVKKPTYTVSQQVVHVPVVTDSVQVIRRPVFAELQQVIHKPIFTEYQQVIKLPTHTAHVLKKPTYTSVHQETVQKPLFLNSEQYHVVQKPSAQVLQLPPQYAQPFTAEIVHVPAVHHQTETQTTVHHPPAVVHEPVVQPLPVLPSPAVSYWPPASYGPGSSWVGSESSFGYGSTFGGLEDAGYFLSPSTCRGGDCQLTKDAEGREIVVVPSSGYSNQQMSYPYYPYPLPASFPSYQQASWPNYLTPLKNTQESGGNSQQPTQARANDEVDETVVPDFEQQPDPSVNDAKIAKLAEYLLNDADFQKVLEEISNKQTVEARSTENENKIKDILSKLTEPEKEKLRSMMEPKKVEDVSTTPASTQPPAEQKKESQKA